MKTFDPHENASTCYLNYGTDEQKHYTYSHGISFPQQRPTR